MKITVMGTPIAKKRPRFVRKTGRAYDDQASESGLFLLNVREQIKDLKETFKGPLFVAFYFYFEVPKSYPKKIHNTVKRGELVYHIKKPDSSNLCKFCEDILNREVWHDDSQICELFVSKYYSTKAKTVIIINELGGGK